jgi:hypothetical protein
MVAMYPVTKGEGKEKEDECNYHRSNGEAMGQRMFNLEKKT